jgi:histidine triad protein
MSKNKMSGHKNANDSAYLKHLEFIQAIVARMAQSSVQTKSLLLPVVVAAYGYALTQKSVSVSLLGIAAVLLFGYIDASYLRQEQAYRRLYNAVIEGTKEIPLLSLNLAEDTELVCEEKSFWKKSGEVIKEWVFLDPKVWLSWAIFPFYFGFFVVGCVVLCYAFMSGC